MSRYPRRVDDDYRFTCGDCHYLARAINKLTGWPLMCFWEGPGEPDNHAFVQHPSGHYLDIKGLWTEERMREFWAEPDQPIEPVDWLVVRDVFGTPKFGNYTYTRAKQLATELVEKYA